jgi:uncharacterized membrane protein
VKVEAASFSGPLPHPALLARYNELIPNGADRVMALAEKQSAHREKQEARVIDGNVRSQTRGSWFAFILSLVIVSGALYLLHQGKNIGGLGAILAGIVPLAAVFFYSKREQAKERANKEVAVRERKAR